MQQPGLVLERAHRVGTRREHKPRTIVARFSRFCDREAVVRNANKLKGTNIFLNDDLCPASQAAKNAQMPLLKQAKAQGKIAFFRHTKLIVRERYNDDGASVAAAGRRGQQPAGDAVNAAVGEAATGGGVRGESRPAAVGDVVGVEVAGAWSSGRAEGLPSLNSPRPDTTARTLPLHGVSRLNQCMARLRAGTTE
ncbi:uncharacterized protein LOC135097826 isoform X1 [Scylla paramamosain]|uniref:uncharacterized protein LOC135097826 isoform X1 n=1 Tax=Scylla paramamosain TaxID=85552 RepID=UPI003083487C